MSTKVEVLCPNGHRINIKTNNNTKLMQILEEACNKKGFSPATDYELRHGSSKKALDLTLTIRFSGLPNNAKLEMVKAAKSRALSNVTLALQLENGERIQKEFSPHTCLWEVLQQAEKDSGKKLTCPPDNTHPVCVYMREEVIGETALKHTTLQRLGLISGRAVIRLLYKPIDPSVLSEIQHQIDKEIAKGIKQTSRTVSSDNVGNVEIKQPQNDQQQNMKSQIDHSGTKDSTEAMDTVTESESSSRVDHIPGRLEEDMQAESGAQEPMETEQKSGSNRGNDTPMESESVTRPKDSHRVHPTASSGGNNGPNTGRRPPGPDTSIPGVQIFRPGEMQLTPEQEGLARQLAETIMPGVFPQRNPADVERLRQERQRRIEQNTNRQPRQPPPIQPQFMEFKFPEETKGQDLYRNEMSEDTRKNYKPCDREAVLYSMDDIKTSMAVPVEPDDDFFEVTEMDMKKMWSDLQRNAVDVADQPLMTQSMKKAQAEARFSKYDRAFIRFTFPDKLVLQAAFRPRETVHNLYKFVKENLEEKTSPFQLYTSPPRIVLEDRSQTLIEAQLVPMTVVYFSSDSRKDHYLSEAAMKEISSQTKANETVIAHIPQSISPPSERGSQGTKRSTPQSQGSSPSKPTDEGGKKVPKWFKVGNK